MTHQTRVRSHVLTTILGSTFGGSLVTTFIHPSYALIAITALSGIALYLLERQQIEDEDNEAETLAPREGTLQIPVITVEGLKKIADRERYNGIEGQENSENYKRGLFDGAADLAQWVLDQIPKESS